jgi:hypothetical protein
MCKTTTKSKSVEDGTFKGSKGTIYHFKFLPFLPSLCDHEKFIKKFHAPIGFSIDLFVAIRNLGS